MQRNVGTLSGGQEALVTAGKHFVETKGEKATAVADPGEIKREKVKTDTDSDAGIDACILPTGEKHLPSKHNPSASSNPIPHVEISLMTWSQTSLWRLAAVGGVVFRGEQPVIYTCGSEDLRER